MKDVFNAIFLSYWKRCYHVRQALYLSIVHITCYHFFSSHYRHMIRHCYYSTAGCNEVSNFIRYLNNTIFSTLLI